MTGKKSNPEREQEIDSKSQGLKLKKKQLSWVFSRIPWPANRNKRRELQWALAKEKAKMERSEERGREELEDEVEIPGLAIPKSEGATVKDRCLVAGRLARVMQGKECEIDRLQEHIAKLQQQLKVTTDNKGEASLKTK